MIQIGSYACCSEIRLLSCLSRIGHFRVVYTLRNLNFACRVDAPGMAFILSFTFILRISEYFKVVANPYKRFWITGRIKADIYMWLEFLRGFNGILLWRVSLLLEASFQISDASGSMQFEAFFQGNWCVQL